jgi:hypothetical protein
MWLFMFGFGCEGATCGAGTHLEDGTCVADAIDDSDDTEDSVPTGPCAPPDAFTGGIDDSLYTNTPYDAGYDAGVAGLIAMLPNGDGSNSGGAGVLVQNATVVAVGSWDQTTSHRIYVSDAKGTVAVLEDASGPRGVVVGQKVSFAVNTFSSYSGERYAEHATGWTPDAGGNPVFARELGQDNLPTAGNTFLHAYGQLDRASAALKPEMT